MPPTQGVSTHPRFERNSVDSSMLAWIEYNKDARVLRAAYKKGTIYDYYGVPPNERAMLLSASSISGYFREHIQGKFPFVKLAEPRRWLRVTMPDGKRWDVPVDVIAMDRATHYAKEFGGDVQKSLAGDTMVLFDADAFEIEDWAANNMNWSDVEPFAQPAPLPAQPVPDYQEGWLNGAKEIVEF